MFTQASTPETRDGSERTSSERVWIATGAVLGLVAVAAGAAGVHALQDALDPDALDTFETAVRFQMFHALALLVVGLLASRWRTRFVDAAGWLLAAGVVLFSGSLYILALTDIGAFGAIAPLGGACLLAGWASLIAAALWKR